MSADSNGTETPSNPTESAHASGTDSADHSTATADTSTTSPPKLSQILTDTLDGLESDQVSMAYLTDKLGVRAYGALLALLTLPNFVPGIASVTGTLCFLFSIQMAMNIQRPWLPQAVRNLTIEKHQLQRAINKLLPSLMRFEHYFKPRLIIFNTPLAIRLMGWVIAVLSLVIMLPLPLTNLLPSITLLFMAFGMLQEDGLTTLISALLGLVFCLLCGWLGFAVIKHLIAAI